MRCSHEGCCRVMRCHFMEFVTILWDKLWWTGLLSLHRIEGRGQHDTFLLTAYLWAEEMTSYVKGLAQSLYSPSFPDMTSEGAEQVPL